MTAYQRKVVMTKKTGTTGEAENEGSPRVYTEDPGRISEMESRVSGLEDQLSKALDEVRDVRNREMGILNLMREMIGHIAKTGKGECPPGLAESFVETIRANVRYSQATRRRIPNPRPRWSTCISLSTRSPLAQARHSSCPPNSASSPVDHPDPSHATPVRGSHILQRDPHRSLVIPPPMAPTTAAGMETDLVLLDRGFPPSTMTILPT